MKSQRNAAFDIAKCLSMYLVVLGHLIADRTSDPAYMINLLHLPVLFFISGFFSVSSVEKRTAGDLLKRKTVSLLIPYLLWSGISLAANSALMILSGSFSLQSFLNEATQIFVYARSVWFLIQLFVTFVIFLGIHKLLEKTGTRKYEIPIYLGVWLVLSLLIPGEVLGFHKFKWLFPFFLCGYLSGKNRERWQVWLSSHRKLSAIGWISLIYPALVAVLVRDDTCRQYTNFTYHSLTGGLSGLMYYAVSAMGVMLMMKISHCLAKTPVGQFAAQIGTYSMDIYVIHMFLIKFIPIPVELGALSPLVIWLLLAAVTLIIVLAIWLLSKYVLRRVKIFRVSVGMN